MKYKTIIVDDEPKLRKVLAIKLEQYCTDIEVVDTAENITEAYTKITNLSPQLVFLDISMPGGSGFDLLDKFSKIPFEVIFVTGYNDYTLDALKISAVDYLLKPVVTAELIKAVEKAKERVNDKAKIQHYDLLKHNVDKIGDQDTKIAVSCSKSYEFVRISNIIRCEGEEKYTRLHLLEGENFLSSYNVGTFKDMLKGYGFYSPHKSHLINTKLIKRYLKEGTIIMSDNSQVPVARRKKEEFVEEVLKHILIYNSPYQN